MKLPATDSIKDCSVTGWGLTVVEPDLVRLTPGESRGHPLDRFTIGESVMSIFIFLEMLDSFSFL